MAYTFLRPNLFMQGLLAFRETITGQGKFFAASGDAKISAIDVRDIGASGAAVLADEGHQGRTYNLTGPQALSHGEMAEKLTGVLRRRIEFVDVPPEAMREALIGAGLPIWQADGLVEDYAHYSRGEAAEVARGVQDATGKPPRCFENFASDYAQAFSEPTAQDNVGCVGDGHVVGDHAREAERVITLDVTQHTTSRWPSFLPDGKHFSLPRAEPRWQVAGFLQRRSAAALE